MIPLKSPSLLTVPLGDRFSAIVNTWYPDSLRVVNKSQLEVLRLVDGLTDHKAIARAMGARSRDVLKLLDMFAVDELIRYDLDFQVPVLNRPPRSLDMWVHTTNKCNLGCNYCYISSLNSSGGMEQLVRDKLLDKLVKTADLRGLQRIKLRFAGGEPLIEFDKWAPFILNARDRLGQMGCRFDASFLTNLTALTDKIIAFATEHDLGFGVSLDGLNKFHDTTRSFGNGRGTFKLVDANIDRLKENRIRFSITSVISDRNIDGLPQFTEYLVKKNVPFRYSIVKGRPVDRMRLAAKLTESFEIMEAATLKGWRFDENFKLCDLKPDELSTQTCGAGYSSAAVYVDGGVYYCHVHFGTENPANGSLFDENTDLVGLIEKGKAFEGMRHDDCRSCNYKFICTSGCPVYRENGKDPNCSLYHMFIPVMYRIRAQQRLAEILREELIEN